MAKEDTIAVLSVIKMECGGAAAHGESDAEGEGR